MYAPGSTACGSPHWPRWSSPRRGRNPGWWRLLEPAGAALAEMVMAVARALGWAGGRSHSRWPGASCLRPADVSATLLERLERGGYTIEATPVAEPVPGGAGAGGPADRREEPKISPLLERLAAAAQALSDGGRECCREPVPTRSTSPSAGSAAAASPRRASRARVELLHYEEFAHAPNLLPRLRDAERLLPRDVAELHVEVGRAFAQACLAGPPAPPAIEPARSIWSDPMARRSYHRGIPGTGAVLEPAAWRSRPDCRADRLARDRRIPQPRHRRRRRRSPDLAPRRSHLFSPKDGAPPPRGDRQPGGITNITILHEDPARIYGFDTGPGNSLIDRSRSFQTMTRLRPRRRARRQGSERTTAARL